MIFTCLGILLSDSEKLNVKIFILSIGDRRRASSRLRIWDHVDWLHEQGHDVTTDFIIPSNLDKINIGVVCRLIVLWPVWAWKFMVADRVLIQETLILSPLLWIKNWIKPRHVVFDFSDPIDLIGSGFRNYLQKLGFVTMTRGANHVIVENNSYLHDLQKQGIKCSQFYGPVDVDRYQTAAMSKPLSIEVGVLRIGWTGSPSTLSFIAPLFPLLDRLASSYQIELMLIGVKEINYSFKFLVVHTISWNEEEEYELVPSFDIGIFVLDGSKTSKRRGAGKLFVYMASGVPFIATHLGIAKDVLSLSEAGFPVDDISYWFKVLESAIISPDKRKSMSIRGVKYANENMSYRVYRNHISSVLKL